MRRSVAATKSSDPSTIQRLKDLLERVRLRAYQIFCARGGATGRALEDWLAAERELFELPAATHLTESGDAYVLTLEAPGFEAGQLHVSVGEDAITVHGVTEKKSKRNGGVGEARQRKELFHQSPLPPLVDRDAVQATMDKGVLRVTLPKTAPVKVAA